MKYNLIRRIRAAQNICFSYDGARQISEQDLLALGLSKDVATRIRSMRQGR